MSKSATSTSSLNDHADRYVTVNGLRLHYVDHGPVDAPAILLIGGIVQQARVWDVLAEGLDDWRTISLDLRGQGDSEWTREGYSLQALTADVEGLVEALELSEFAVVGHSLGGRIAMAYAATSPAGLKAVVLSDTGPGIRRPRALGARSVVGEALSLRGFRDEATARAHYQEHYPRWDPRFYDIYARHQFRKNWVGRLVPNFDPDIYWITSAASLPDIDLLWGAIPKIVAPVLILRATLDGSYLDDDILARMQHDLPDNEVASFSTGHYVFLEDPAGSLDALTGFLHKHLKA